jgi:hypothetical protein
MVKWLQNKNRTDPPKMTIETLKETLDQFDFVFLPFFTQFIFPGYLTWNWDKTKRHIVRPNFTPYRSVFLVMGGYFYSFGNLFNVVFFRVNSAHTKMG